MLAGARRLLRRRPCGAGPRALGVAVATDDAAPARCEKRAVGESFAPRAQTAVPFHLSPAAARDTFQAWCRCALSLHGRSMQRAR
jgi:hypothetical protein